jgi:hypothetical protein
MFSYGRSGLRRRSMLRSIGAAIPVYAALYAAPHAAA